MEGRALNQLKNGYLIQHGPGAPSLRVLGLGPRLIPVNAIEQLQTLLEENTFWAKGRTKKQLKQMIKNSNAVKSNADYRKYLTSNATQIMSQSMTNEMYNNVNNISMAPGTNVQTPYNFKNLEDRTQVRPNTFSSDLKQMYLSRNEQQAKI